MWIVLVKSMLVTSLLYVMQGKRMLSEGLQLSVQVQSLAKFPLLLCCILRKGGRAARDICIAPALQLPWPAADVAGWDARVQDHRGAHCMGAKYAWLPCRRRSVTSRVRWTWWTISMWSQVCGGFSMDDERLVRVKVWAAKFCVTEVLDGQT